ncbi:MAG: hypothetical protein IPI43_32295 [Sandaracinaceae bacterium]|nr:hypothetical protein [Sandaracinaceae bacterium]
MSHGTISVVDPIPSKKQFARAYVTVEKEDRVPVVQHQRLAAHDGITYQRAAAEADRTGVMGEAWCDHRASSARWWTRPSASL